MSDDQIMQAWDKFVEGLKSAGKQMDTYTKDLDPMERADGFRAITRILAPNLEKLEMDGIIPEVIRDNKPNHKWFMDNPDGQYWHIVVDPKQKYLIKGNLGEACYTSVTAYRRTGDHWAQTTISASIGDDELNADKDGSFEVKVGGEQPSSGPWIPLEEGVWLIWIRQLFDDIYNDRHGWFTVKNLEPVRPPTIEPEQFAEKLGLLGDVVSQIVSITYAQSMMESRHRPNEIRRWDEMKGGAVFTLAGIDYMRGSWQLGPDEALVLDGKITPCKHWNIVLYSRFLNSLEHRTRSVSLTGARVTSAQDGAYRLVIAHSDPGVPNWLDTEGREFGMYVIRWLFPEGETVLPTVKVMKLADLKLE